MRRRLPPHSAYRFRDQGAEAFAGDVVRRIGGELAREQLAKLGGGQPPPPRPGGDGGVLLGQRDRIEHGTADQLRHPPIALEPIHLRRVDAPRPHRRQVGDTHLLDVELTERRQERPDVAEE